ncbi:uncharacterized protein LOC142632636 [Castanea sativa]|uniref:uncharacterized protein LOC142632636 n=1 Tax=Castanea sativa TaxID=21020 RepID=UPI003F64DA51
MNKSVTESICESVGKVCRTIDGADEEGGSFMRVKVVLDISLPQCRGRLITLENREKSWVRFKYECLPNICYWCGCLDHNYKDCVLWIKSKGTLSPDQHQFNSSLRAPSYRVYNKPVVSVPGFFDNVDNSRPRNLAKLGVGSVAATGASILHHPSMTEPDSKMDLHDPVINEVDLPPKTGPVGCEASPSVSNQLSDFSLKEAQTVGNSPISLGVAAGGNPMGNEPKDKAKITRKFDDVTEEISVDKGVKAELRSMSTSSCCPVSAEVGLGRPISEVRNLANSGPQQDPSKEHPVVNPRVDDAWRFTGFYGSPEVANREDSWTVSRHLGSQFSMLWVCIEDFIEITRIQEKSGGCIRPESQMQGFRDCLDVCGLKDLGFSGLPFTWCNRRYDGPVTWVRLDRAVASADWMLKFPTARLHHLSGSSSDHCPIWLCSDDVQRHFFRPNKPFRFEAMWLKDASCKGVVQSAWDMGLTNGPMENVLLKLVKVEALSMVGGSHASLKPLCEEIEKLMKLEECMWNQRAKSGWLMYRDQNTKYFHCWSSKRNKRNFIAGLENDAGEWTEKEDRVGDMLVNYYTGLFTSSNPLSLDPVLSGVEPRVSSTMNDDLDRPFEASEVRVALQAKTALGPDGLPPLFYKQFWDTVGSEVSNAVLSILNSGILPNSLNHTFLTLIPKVKSARLVTDFCPISLSNVQYKLIAKVFANRLKPLLP